MNADFIRQKQHNLVKERSLPEMNWNVMPR